MKRTIWQKRIPTFLGIIFIVIGIGLTSSLVKNGIIFTGRASPPHTPDNIRITNISDTSLTISYTTSDKVLGTISFGKDKNLGSTSLDDRDQETGNVTAFKTHHFTLKNLQPKTKYFFSIVSAQDTFLNDGAPFEITTAPPTKDFPPPQKPIAGKIILPDGNNPDEAIIYVVASNSQTLSTVVKQDGSYILPLNSILASNLSTYFPISENTIIQILVIGSTQKSNATLLAKQANPVPLITLSKDYDFTINVATSIPNPVASESATTTEAKFPLFSTNPSSTKDPQITTPKKNEEFLDQQPLIKGTAPPNTEVKIIINSEEQIQAEVKTDSKGNWVYRPTKPLAPGQHTISITTKDQYGILKTIKQSFTVFATGSQINPPATPSATLTPPVSVTPTFLPPSTPIPTSTPAPTTLPTQIPTMTQTPTPTFRIIPTAIPTTPSVKGGGTEKISPPGSSSIVIGGAAALLTTIAGILLFLITRGSISSL